MRGDYFPVKGTLWAGILGKCEYHFFGDYRFEKLHQKLVRQSYPEKAESLLENIDISLSVEDGKDWGGGHKIGGYPGFLRSRILVEKVSSTISLLFQLDSGAITARTSAVGRLRHCDFLHQSGKIKDCDFQ